ncbi:MAG: bifunctional UDP-N-acetylglucosamine diphosphorylase/glucosamine-1-phosphate N-acetyltransferase GlmU [Solirubrobacteraceae bacterium]
MAAPVVIVLAAGQGTRMRSATPKVLHEICGRPMALWPVHAALDAGAGDVVLVGGPDRALEAVLPEGVSLAVQEQPLGTADAVKSASGRIDPGAPVVVLAGDVPLIRSETIAALLEAHAAGGCAATMLTMELEDPSGYGRVVRAPDGSVERVVETKVPADATAAELALREVNTGIFAFSGGPLLAALQAVRPDNAQGEYYLPDVLPALRDAGHAVGATLTDDPSVTIGVNDRAQLAEARSLAQARIAGAHMAAGAGVIDPVTTVIDAGVEIGADSVIEPFTALRGATRIAAGARIGSFTTLIGSAVGEGATVLHSHLLEAEVRPGATVGPFAYLRPGTVVREDAKVGTFVEVKNSDVGAGSKVPHLSYLGDADVGEGTNLGAGTITANYDGVSKHRTTIGSGVKGGVDVSLVAPVELGDGSWTAAGSVITEDVPPGALGVARERQANVEGYAERRARDAEEAGEP